MQLAARNCSARARVRSTTTTMCSNRQQAGMAMHHINQNTLSKGVEHKAVKACFDQVCRAQQQTWSARDQQSQLRTWQSFEPPLLIAGSQAHLPWRTCNCPVPGLHQQGHRGAAQ